MFLTSCDLENGVKVTKILFVFASPEDTSVQVWLNQNLSVLLYLPIINLCRFDWWV